MDAKGLLSAMIAMCAESHAGTPKRPGSRRDDELLRQQGMTDLTVKSWMLVYDVDKPEAEDNVIERIQDTYLSLIAD